MASQPARAPVSKRLKASKELHSSSFSREEILRDFLEAKPVRGLDTVQPPLPTSSPEAVSDLIHRSQPGCGICLAWTPPGPVSFLYILNKDQAGRGSTLAPPSWKYSFVLNIVFLITSLRDVEFLLNYEEKVIFGKGML